MEENKLIGYIENVLKNIPGDWLKLTTHRLDIYNEDLAKTEFLNQFEGLYKNNNSEIEALSKLPTAFDYIRLGHPLSSVLEWAVAQSHGLKPESVISFASRTIPVLAVLRKNFIDNKNTQINYSGELPGFFDFETIRRVYGYDFEVKQVKSPDHISDFNGSTIFISQKDEINTFELHPKIDFLISLQPPLGSLLLANNEQHEGYVSEIQHVRRRETIAMTPQNSFYALQKLVDSSFSLKKNSQVQSDKTSVVNSIHKITATNSNVQLGSCGLSIQYAIMMGLIDNALKNYPGKDIKIIVPPNCYGGTNDQARRVAACVKNVEVLDLPVDGGNNMVKSVDQVLTKVAQEGGIPFIIAEIPTNPRVEVPDLEDLRTVLSKPRKTALNKIAIEPVFILDQTFCPNVQFLSKDGILASIKTISYVSGSKFPSGGKCTAGYCVANEKAEFLMPVIAKHLQLCDNEATDLQIKILAEQLPSMNQRIADAYKNTREFVSYIEEKLPTAKINFVSEALAKEGFTPSVFSLDLPTKGNTEAEKETYKRALNQKLINMMITQIPDESKYCVSYGQLKGCYWTIPATSTQGTTKEADKDYIARVSVSPNLDLEHHKKVFSEFIDQL